MLNTFRPLLIFLSVISIFISFWLFARFTVDDAFITWRFGQNLIDSGIWNYNPSTFDLTQSYTNPIYAALSIIPAYLSIDVVLFFKLISLLILSTFFIYFYKKTKSLLMTLIAYASPLLFIHAFSGLETFLYISLLVALFISLNENKPIRSVFITVAIMLTRPEAWLLVAIVPVYFLFRENFKNSHDLLKISSLKKNIFTAFKNTEVLKIPIIIFIILIIFLSFYFYMHKILFGYALPNTFYAKTNVDHLVQIYANFEIFISILLVIIIFISFSIRKTFFLTLLFGGFFIAVGVQYTLSNLQMNYNSRFIFHILMPVYFMLVYIASKNNQHKYSFLDNQVCINSAALILLCLLTLQNLNINLYGISTYYPRLLESHGSLGRSLKALKNSNRLNSFAFGDAGITAYNSEINAFDNIGLGSSMLVQEGISKKILNIYNPKVIVLYANQNGLILDKYNQEFIKNWADKKDFIYLCNVYWHSSNFYMIYIDQELNNDIEGINLVCKNSNEKNNVSGKEYLKYLIKNPLYYWHS
jgi:hypothetical protein